MRPRFVAGPASSELGPAVALTMGWSFKLCRPGFLTFPFSEVHCLILPNSGKREVGCA